MQTYFKLNADELNNDFLESIKTLFAHKTIEVAIHEVDDKSPSIAVVQAGHFARLPNGLKISRDELYDRKPDYLSMAVDEIVIPSRDER